MGDDSEPLLSEEGLDQSVFPGWRQPGFAVTEDIDPQGLGRSRPTLDKGNRKPPFPVGLEGGSANRGGGFDTHVITNE